MTAGDVQQEIQHCARADYAASLQRFFKTGPGQYGEGDVFVGVRMPDVRMVCKKFKALELAEIQKLYDSGIHEHRMAAGIILTYQFPKADDKKRQAIYKLYLKNVRRGRVNNWDLVDLTAPNIVGEYLQDKPRAVLFELAASDSLWERRVAMLACFSFIARGEPDTALEIGEILLHDKHDLIQKAVGWMLREVGKRIDRKLLTNFLDKHAGSMPRTALRYAIEHLPPEMRAHYLGQKVGKG